MCRQSPDNLLKAKQTYKAKRNGGRKFEGFGSLHPTNLSSLSGSQR
jgi:hypothetical protein